MQKSEFEKIRNLLTSRFPFLSFEGENRRGEVELIAKTKQGQQFGKPTVDNICSVLSFHYAGQRYECVTSCVEATLPGHDVTYSVFMNGRVSRLQNQNPRRVTIAIELIPLKSITLRIELHIYKPHN